VSEKETERDMHCIAAAAAAAATTTYIVIRPQRY